jgi:hypothetical protein
MAILPSSEKLTEEQSDTLERAAYKVINARTRPLRCWRDQG